ncbi:hypothetical protein B0H17DRAFT_1330820 [Mycena rosella]|uniref:Uncharacterized protein n=1 Tax=Mycena rosella TaxID=1033263 RepID=A0AAD7DIM3_MYCRO|nr:hypothetical protein B0H17DRAFT_1330820 [Mycena rosella]
MTTPPACATVDISTPQRPIVLVLAPRLRRGPKRAVPLPRRRTPALQHRDGRYRPGAGGAGRQTKQRHVRVPVHPSTPHRLRRRTHRPRARACPGPPRRPYAAAHDPTVLVRPHPASSAHAHASDPHRDREERTATRSRSRLHRGLPSSRDRPPKNPRKKRQEKTVEDEMGDEAGEDPSPCRLVIIVVVRGLAETHTPADKRPATTRLRDDRRPHTSTRPRRLRAPSAPRAKPAAACIAGSRHPGTVEKHREKRHK